MTGTGLTIIVAEDDESHAALIRRCLERARLQARVIQMRTSREVMEYFANPDRPLHSVLVLLNIRFSGRDGIEVLQHLKSKPETQAVPVYVLTGDDNAR